MRMDDVCGFPIRCTVTMEDASTGLGVLYVEHAKNVRQKWWWMRAHFGMEDWLFHFDSHLPSTRFEIGNLTLIMASTSYWKADLDRLATRTRLRS